METRYLYQLNAMCTHKNFIACVSLEEASYEINKLFINPRECEDCFISNHENDFGMAYIAYRKVKGSDLWENKTFLLEKKYLGNKVKVQQKTA